MAATQLHDCFLAIVEEVEGALRHRLDTGQDAHVVDLHAGNRRFVAEVAAAVSIRCFLGEVRERAPLDVLPGFASASSSLCRLCVWTSRSCIASSNASCRILPAACPAGYFVRLFGSAMLDDHARVRGARQDGRVAR